MIPPAAIDRATFAWSAIFCVLLAASVAGRPPAALAVGAIFLARTALNRHAWRAARDGRAPDAAGVVVANTILNVAVGHVVGWNPVFLLYVPFMTLIAALYGAHRATRNVIAMLSVLAVGAWVDRADPLGFLAALTISGGMVTVAQMRAALLERAHEETRKRTRDLERLQAALIEQEKLSSLGQLAAGIAHEINNPMGWVTSNLQTMLADLDRPLTDDVLREWRGEVLPETIEGARRVNTIVSDLRRFARADREATSPFDVGAEVERSIRLCEKELGDGVRVVRDIEPGAIVAGRPAQIGQVMVNLLLNAADAMRGTPGEVVVSVRRDAHDVVLVVADQGHGMTRDTLARVFEPFFTTKPPGRGVGLGLAVVHGVVKAHGGAIDVTSKVGVGTTFTIRLPPK